jgi:hypothetical protein
LIAREASRKNDKTKQCIGTWKEEWKEDEESTKKKRKKRERIILQLKFGTKLVD